MTKEKWSHKYETNATSGKTRQINSVENHKELLICGAKAVSNAKKKEV